MRGSKFYLNFKSDSTGRIEISEPVGFDSADFAIIQEDGRLGRDVEFAGGNGKFQFSRLKHANVFDILQRYYSLYGFESVIDLEIDYAGLGNIIIIGNLDFLKANNNTFDLIECDVILDQDKSRIKKNIEVKTDLFSALDVDGGVISQVVPQNILLKAKPVVQLSSFEQPSQQIAQTGGIGGSTTRYFNFANAVINSGIDNTLSFIQGFGNKRDFGYIEALDTLSDVTLKISNLTVKVKETASSYPFGQGSVSMYYAIGLPNVEPTGYYNNQVFSFGFFGTPENQEYNITNQNFVFPNLTINRGERLYIFFEAYTDTQNTPYILTTTISSMDVEITGTKTSYASVNKGVRLIDAIRYNVKSAGNAIVYFPMAEQGGYLYNQFILNGNLLRNITEKPFYLMFKDINEWFPELNLDYEIQADGVIFIGQYQDYYSEIEMGVITQTTYDDFEKNFNDEFAINLFEYKYSNYQSQKENDVANTYDVVHGETQLKLFNKNVSGKADIEVKFIRDPFTLEENRIKAFRKDDNSATQDDDKIFIVDVYPSNLINTSAIPFTETDFLQHYFDTATGYLTLRNNGSFRFDILGIQVGGGFAITTTPAQLNSGIYTVIEVSTNYIVLQPFGSTNPTTGNNGERYTRFTYQVPVSSIAGMNWTNEEFSIIENIANPDNFGNLRFSVRRNIERYNSYLATCNKFHESLPARNVFYKNNPEAFTVLNGVALKEGEHILPDNPILSPMMATLDFTITFDKFYEFLLKTRSAQRGFIRCFDPFGNVMRLYPKDMRFRATAEREGTMTLIGKEKYVSSLLNITDANQGFIRLNNEYTMQFLRYEIKNNYFYIKDENGVLLYNKLLFDQITVNNATASNETELSQWLDLLIEP